MLSIFRLNAIYFPIEPNYPPGRIESLLNHAKPRIIVSDLDNYQEHLRECCPIYTLEDILQSASDRSLSPAKFHPDNICYLLYTSGSTGNPKGAKVKYQGMVNHLFAKIADMKMDSTCILAQTASQCFDISIWQFLSPLLVGGRVEVFDDKIVREPRQLLRSIRDKNITIYETVPTLLEAMLDYLNYEGGQFNYFKSLEYLMVTGEAFPTSLCNRWFEYCKTAPIPVINAFGPTECSDDVAHFIAKKPIDSDIVTVPIGKPIINTKLYVVDESGYPVVLGAPGELWISGIGVGDGYLRNPEQTALSFIRNPFLDNNDHQLVYRTGDRVRRLPCGNLEFLGRINNVVKIRGNLVDLYEISSLLEQQAIVRRAVVLQDTVNSLSRLYAYLLLDKTDDSSHDEVINDLMTQLKHRLPTYMIPDDFIIIDNIPINVNGKINTAALPRPNHQKRLHEVELVKARDEIDHKLLSIWQNVFNSSDIGLKHNFFDLGGQSIQAIQIVARINVMFDTLINVSHLIQNPTIESLRASIENLAHTTSVKFVPPVPRIKDNAIKLTTTINDSTVNSVLGQIHSSAIGYLPRRLTTTTGLSRTEIKDALKHSLSIRNLYATHLGNIAHILIPMFEDELYTDTELLLENLELAAKLSLRLGSRVMSLTGIIPSATEYGVLVDKRLKLNNHETQVSTGHSVTTYAVVINIDKVLKCTNRTITREHVAFLGLGSVGSAVLRLMLSVMEQPKEITLCDLFSKEQELLTLRQELKNKFLFRGKINIISYHTPLSDVIYQASFIIGATNVPDILDVYQLTPGTIIIDDSAPHCIDTQKLSKRVNDFGDVLMVEGGIISLSKPITDYAYIPDSGDIKPIFENLASFRYSEYDLMGCILSGLLNTLKASVAPDIGPLETHVLIQQYRRLKSLEIFPAELSLMGAKLTQTTINRFNNMAEIVS
ncbi:hypothetical protein AB835_06715 [Candidatus Endobugula sertula]|uniref:Carrier domain-containing protein n=1 Tax=Candidatus Endobugula sertula TaxID=62101 RepID=A0A1D2QQL6_9GAMM|nr:hypothetical protein AB835_06715 [Candidatus Endobugula sertula]